jgi:uncharacterized protein YigE (DUF2233 family)
MRHVAAALLFAIPAAVGAQSARTTTSAAPASAAARIAAITCNGATSARPTAAPALTWRGTTVRWAEWSVELGAARVRNRIIVALLDPKRVALSLAIARRNDALAPWTIEDAPDDALLAVNAGQFTDAGPWGWVRHDGREQQAPGAGSLAAAFAVDTAGRATVLAAADIPAARRDTRWREALQSYPQLLARGEPVPAMCRGNAIDRAHRDARLVIGVRADGQVLVILSRYTGAGRGVSVMAERVPIGPTTPEMAEIARRLGATDALMLDGGLSAQLRIRDGDDQRWPGLRAVPLALVARVRQP